MTVASYEIGASEVGMENIESLTTALPPPSYAPYQPGSRRIDLPDGSVRWLGWPWTEWHFPLLTDDQRDQLKSFCSGESATAYIQTLIRSSGTTYDAFSGTMVWPDAEDRRGGFVYNLKIRFQKLVEL